MNELIIKESAMFENEIFGELTVITDENGDLWFIGKEVANKLGYLNERKAILDHVKEKNKVVTKWNSLGGKQNTTLINESGLYQLVMKSKMEQAEKFQEWVCDDILPSIRKTGGYNLNDNSPKLMNDLINELSESRKENLEIKSELKEIKTILTKLLNKNNIIQLSKPNIDTSNYISSKELAEKLNIYTLHDTPHGKIIDSIAIHNFGWLVNNKPNEINEYFKTELLTETGYPTVYYSPKACLMLEQEFNNIKPIEITPKGLKYNFGGKHNFNVKKRS